MRPRASGAPPGAPGRSAPASATCGSPPEGSLGPPARSIVLPDPQLQSTASNGTRRILPRMSGTYHRCGIAPKNGYSGPRPRESSTGTAVPNLAAMKRPLTLLTVAVTLLFSTSVAFAEALVQVKVRGATAEGQVTLTAVDGGQTYTCETSGRECRIDGVPGGRYRVTFRPERGPSSRATNAMIPPSGTVTLFVSSGSRR